MKNIKVNGKKIKWKDTEFTGIFFSLSNSFKKIYFIGIQVVQFITDFGKIISITGKYLNDL